ncbi:unnamed protein product [Mytilus coruscus]|uniref:Apple domain-containing protein n=1 Tax=Mytilus coruscus TaxID=42192 RepID=A0A6J8C1X8_MYTCO|nr:unnamed protein product [Mytilus coruscus]
MSLATNYNTQGYRTAGVDNTFKNCNTNPNSYITFYYNPNYAYPGKVGISDTFMTGWIVRSSLLASNRNNAAEFYFDWEMQMGGCGGYMTSEAVSNTRAALGLPFVPENSIGYFNSCQDPDKRVVLLSLGIFSSTELLCAAMCLQLNACAVFKYHSQDKRCELLSFGTYPPVDDPKPTEAGWKYYTESYAGKKACVGCFFCS